MIIDIYTLFPEQFPNFLATSIIKRALAAGVATINVIDFRAYSGNKHNKVDDVPYGGGPGMVLAVPPLARALAGSNAYKVLLTPAGRKYDQALARRLAQAPHLALICGHYEGYDARIEDYVDCEISLGDFILTGGELAAMVVADSVIRLLPGAIAPASLADESFTAGLLEYAQYTKPASFEGRAVPEVLLSGHHEKIRRFRLRSALKRTRERRPDLLEKRRLTAEEAAILADLAVDAEK